MKRVRRQLIVLLPVGALALATSTRAAGDPNMEETDDPFALPRIKESHPRAIALGYVRDATSVDRGRQPTYQAGQTCANCALFGGKGAWGPCLALPGAVAAAGWCNQYAVRKT